MKISYFQFWVKILKAHCKIELKADITNYIFQNYPKGIIQNPEFIEDVQLNDFVGFISYSILESSLDHQINYILFFIGYLVLVRMKTYTI